MCCGMSGGSGKRRRELETQIEIDRETGVWAGRNVKLRNVICGGDVAFIVDVVQSN